MVLLIDSISRFVLKPYGMVIFTVFLSMTGWFVNGYYNELDAFHNPEPIISKGGLMVLCWYFAIVVVSILFFSLGRKVVFLSDFLDEYASLNDFSAYLILSAGSVVGTYACISHLVHELGWQEVWSTLLEQKGYIFYQVMLDNYHRGILTVRYCVPVAAGIALYRCMTMKRIGVIDFTNFILLVMLVFIINARLFFIAAILFGVGLYILNNRINKIPIVKVTVFIAIAFALMTLFNSARNGNTFKHNGNDSAISANVSEITAYLGTPFQVSLAVGNKYSDAKRGVSYTQLASVHPGMSTNSVFYEMVGRFGDGAWPLIWAETAFLSFIMGASSHYRRNYMIMVYLVALYIMAELWRINMLGAGGMIFLMAGSFVATLCLAFMNKVLGRRVEVNINNIEDVDYDPLSDDESFIATEDIEKESSFD